MKGNFMKKIIILPLVLVGTLALTGCDSYSDFALVEDSETAESTFEELKTKNEQVDNVSGYENIMSISGTTTNEDEEEISISVSMTQRVGIDDTHYASDLIMESDYGTLYTYTRFNSTDNMYYDYVKLNYTYEEEGVEATIDNDLFYENSAYDVSTVYGEEEISAEIGIHILASMEYSEDIKIYTNSDGYYKIEYIEDEYTQDIIFNDVGLAMEISATDGEISMTETLGYEANLDEVATEEYEERDFEYTMTFFAYYMGFLSLSLGGMTTLV
jgi:hypothetical protein